MPTVSKHVPKRAIAVVALLVGGGTVLGRLLGYNFGLHTVVRCRQGHLFTTIWIPGVKLKAIDLGIARLQWCPVGHHWTLVLPVKPTSLTEEERRQAATHRDVRLP
jgi:hypothetical protein